MVAAGRGVGGKAGARPPVGAQNVVEKERRNVGEAGPEERGEVGGRFATVDALLEGESHRRIAQERLAHPLPGRERRRAENHEPTRAFNIRRDFERHVAAQAPADE